jgi:hypothetical protein
VDQPSRIDDETNASAIVDESYDSPFAAGAVLMILFGICGTGVGALCLTSDAINPFTWVLCIGFGLLVALGVTVILFRNPSLSACDEWLHLLGLCELIGPPMLAFAVFPMVFLPMLWNTSLEYGFYGILFLWAVLQNRRMFRHMSALTNGTMAILFRIVVLITQAVLIFPAGPVNRFYLEWMIEKGHFKTWS